MHRVIGTRKQTRRRMGKGIQDEFTKLPISRQRKYQLRKKRDSCCTECGAPAVNASRCLKHLILARERQRIRFGLKNRYFKTLSYRLEALASSAKAAGKSKTAWAAELPAARTRRSSRRSP